MPHKILWTVTPQTHDRIKQLTGQLHNLAITEAQWIDEVMRLPGYPLRGQPGRDDQLVIQVEKPLTLSVPRGTTH